MGLDEVRIQRNYTKEQLAKLLKVTRPTLNKYINDMNTMPLGIYIRACDVLNIDYEYLIKQQQ
jgi:transcriptional regulator with XRE-family HTH domain